jgi:hypothetical protein
MPSQAFVKQSYSQAYVRPAYMATPRMTTVPDSLRLTANGQGASPRGLQAAGTSGGLSQNGVRSAATSGSMKALGQGGSNARRAGGLQGAQRGRSDAARRAAGVRAFAGIDVTGLKHELEPERGSGNAEMPGSAQDPMQSPFERLGDPFRSASASGFEGFGTKSGFDRACGAACSLRSKGGADPFGGGSRERRRSGEMPDSQIPDAKLPDTKITFGPGLKLP